VFIPHLLIYPINDCRSFSSLSNLYYDLLFLYPVYMYCSLSYLYFAWSSTKYYVNISNNTVNFQPVFHTFNKSPTRCIKAYNIAASDITPHRLNDFKYQDLKNHPFLTYIFFTYIILTENILLIVTEWWWYKPYLYVFILVQKTFHWRW
jgi:hypothetical protein